MNNLTKLLVNRFKMSYFYPWNFIIKKAILKAKKKRIPFYTKHI